MIRLSGDWPTRQRQDGEDTVHGFGGGTDYGGAPCNDILGKTRLESDCKNCIYGNHILSPCFGIYLCEYSIWNTLWSNDTGHWWACKKINTSRSVAAMIAIGVLNIITVPLINKFGSSSAKTGYLTVAVFMDAFLQHVISFALQRQKRLWSHRKKKNFYKSPAKSGASESSVSAGSGRTDFTWFYFIWKKCGCPVLFYLCRRKCLVLYHFIRCASLFLPLLEQPAFSRYSVNRCCR